MKKIFLIAFVAAAVAACATGKTGTTTDKTAAKGVMTGGDRDAHGCIPSAGYTWSEVRGECVRLFEKGVRMVAEKEPNATHAAYAVFSADSSKVEFFRPGGSTSILDRVKSENPTWRNREMDLLVNYPGKGWVMMDSKDAKTYIQSR